MWIFSKLDTDKLKAINDLENKLGVTLIAFSHKDTKYADLDEEGRKEVHALEEELGMNLVALDIK